MRGRWQWCGLVVAAALIAVTGCRETPSETPDAGPDDGPDVCCVLPPDVGPDADDGPDEAYAPDLPNALGGEGHELLPWPSDQYMVPTEEGLRLRPDPALLPPGFTPALLEGSGASRVTPIVISHPDGFDPASLPDPDDWGATLEPESPVRVIVLSADGEPEAWPVMAEIDLTEEDPAQATLLIRPHRPFPGGSRVVVGLTREIRGAACADAPDGPDCDGISASPALRRILDGEPQGRAEEAWVYRGRDALVAALPLISPDHQEVALAFSFTVRSAEEIVDPLVAMQAMASEADASTYTLNEISYREDRALIYGTLEVPWFLDDDDRLVVDEDGMPQIVEYRNTPILITIPDTVSSTRPVVLFGHGFFSSIEESTWGNLFNGLRQWEMTAVTARFHGFNEADLGKAITALSADTLDGLIGIIDLQRQSQANFTVVHNLISEHLAQEVEVDFGDGPFHPLSADNIPYMGISNGGTQGFVMMSTSPVLTRGALVVPGGGWSHMLQRAAQWNALGTVLQQRYENNFQIQLASAMLQQAFDPVDSLNFAEHLVEDRLPGLPESPELLVVEAVNDSQVANLVTRWVTGTAQIPVIAPNVAEVWDTPTTDASPPDGAPGGVAFESYDLGVEDNPAGNVAPEENGVHDDVRRLPTYREQMGIFLEEGRVIRTCDGPCFSD